MDLCEFEDTLSTWPVSGQLGPQIGVEVLKLGFLMGIIQLPLGHLKFLEYMRPRSSRCVGE